MLELGDLAPPSGGSGYCAHIGWVVVAVLVVFMVVVVVFEGPGGLSAA